jgi:hypothetical protein
LYINPMYEKNTVAVSEAEPDAEEASRGVQLR